MAEANAEGIRKINEAIGAGGENYLRFKQLELLPQIVPAIANALAQARLITVSGGNNGEGAPGDALRNVTNVIQTVLAAQLFSKPGVMDAGQPGCAAAPETPASAPTSAPTQGTAPAPTPASAAPTFTAMTAKPFPGLRG